METDETQIQTKDQVVAVNAESTQQEKEAGNIGLLYDIDVALSIELGTRRMQIKDILTLGKNSVIELDKSAGEPLDIRVNGNLIARGEVVVINEKYGIRLTEVVSKSKRMEQI